MKVYAFINSSMSGTVQGAYCIGLTVNDVVAVISRQKKGKSSDPYGLCMEAFMYAGLRLYVHLSLIFTFCIRHCFLPNNFMFSTIVPLVKNKGGDLTDKNNYRAIALSNAETKILEMILLQNTVQHANSDKYQFGFKSRHSTSLCTGVMKQTIDYYTSRGSHVFVCFADFSKAFDNVNYWKLFNQLTDDGVPPAIVSLLAYWYSHQEVSVMWHNIVSQPFLVGNGTKQGGILSPYLFTRYIKYLLNSITFSQIGCNIGDLYVNLLAYADDIALLAPSWNALQKLISILEGCCKLLDITCNTKKTVCMVFSPKDRAKIVATNFPPCVLCGQPLQYVSEFRYLGHIITVTLTDDNDINREIRNLYARTNTLIRRFGRCSHAVKRLLFSTYCTCLYGSALWVNYSNATLRRFRSCYHRCICLLYTSDAADE